MPLVFFFGLVLFCFWVFFRNEEGDINTHKQTCIFRDAYISWPWEAEWPIWSSLSASSSWGAWVLQLCWGCVSLSSAGPAAGVTAGVTEANTGTHTWILLHVPSRAVPEEAWALVSCCCLFCSAGRLSSPLHVPCSSWPSEECDVLLTGHSPLLSCCTAGKRCCRSWRPPPQSS